MCSESLTCLLEPNKNEIWSFLNIMKIRTGFYVVEGWDAIEILIICTLALYMLEYILTNMLIMILRENLKRMWSDSENSLHQIVRA